MTSSDIVKGPISRPKMTPGVIGEGPYQDAK